MILNHRISENNDQGQEYWSIVTGAVRREEYKERASHSKDSGAQQDSSFYILLLLFGQKASLN